VATNPPGTVGGTRSLTTVTPMGVAPLAALKRWSGIATAKNSAPQNTDGRMERIRFSGAFMVYLARTVTVAVAV
jgi:hypothetical protein